jgi:colanic acid biosynthesis glycosyl transferase WcaI
MRILIYGINFAPELIGIGKYTGEMAAFFAAHGHTVRVVTAPPYYPHWRVAPEYSAWAYTQEKWQDVTVYRCPLWVPHCTDQYPTISGFQRILHLASFAISSLPVILGQAHWRPDWVIVLAPSIFDAPAGALAARLARGRAWLHVQDFELDAALGLKMLPGMGLFSRLAQFLERSLYRSFERISTISNRMLAHLQEKGTTPERTVLFPNWVDCRLIYPLYGYNGLRRELSIDGNCRVILYSGNIGQKQGLDVLIEAARSLADEPGLIFLICGEGSAKPRLAALASGLPNVRFLPLQPPGRLNELLNLADIHVLPQSANAADLVMPSKLAGMLASGRPIIVTACPGTELADVMEPLGRVILPGRPAELADAIRTLLGDSAAQADLGRRGRAFVERTWSKEIVLERFLETLQAG